MPQRLRWEEYWQSGGTRCSPDQPVRSPVFPGLAGFHLFRCCAKHRSLADLSHLGHTFDWTPRRSDVTDARKLDAFGRVGGGDRRVRGNSRLDPLGDATEAQSLHCRRVVVDGKIMGDWSVGRVEWLGHHRK